MHREPSSLLLASCILSLLTAGSMPSSLALAFVSMVAAWKIATPMPGPKRSEWRVQVILKPAEATPLTALALAELAHRAGMPEGVLNIVVGDPKAIGIHLSWVFCAAPPNSEDAPKTLLNECWQAVPRKIWARFVLP